MKLLESGIAENKDLLLGLGATLAPPVAAYLLSFFSRWKSTSPGNRSRPGSTTAAESNVLRDESKKDNKPDVDSEEEISQVSAGAEEQEPVCHELQKQESIVKLLSMKIDLLQAENHRVRLLASQNLGVAKELQSARSKIKNLKRTLKSSQVKARKKIDSLDRKIALLKSKLHEAEDINAQVESKLKQLENLQEEEAAVLKETNSMLGEQLSLSILQDSQSKASEETIEQFEQIDADEQSQVIKIEDAENQATQLRKETFILEQENLDLAQKLALAKVSLSDLQKPQTDEASEHIVNLLQNKAREEEQIDPELQRELEAVEHQAKFDLDLAQRLTSVQISRSSPEKPQEEALVEIKCLRDSNDKLQKKLKQLEADHSAEVEESKYLIRWLSVTLSKEPSSFRGALRREEGYSRRRLSPISDEFAGQHFSDHELEYGAVQSGTSSMKVKFFGKVKRLVMRKGGKSHKEDSSERNPERRLLPCDRAASASTCSNERNCSCISEEQRGTKSSAGSELDAAERWRNSSAWIHGGFQSHYAGPRSMRLREFLS